MGNNDKTFDSSPNQQLQSKPDRQQAWAQLTAKYLQDLPQQLDGIRTVLQIKDYTTIKKWAHRIKGTSGTYRLDTISKSAAQLEHLADSQNPDKIVTTINKVRRLVELETKKLNSQLVSSADSSEGVANG
jgi:HPt (histidine-containing phosphotransfer) domain-containing protein